MCYIVEMTSFPFPLRSQACTNMLFSIVMNLRRHRRTEALSPLVPTEEHDSDTILIFTSRHSFVHSPFGFGARRTNFISRLLPGWVLRWWRSPLVAPKTGVSEWVCMHWRIPRWGPICAKCHHEYRNRTRVFFSARAGLILSSNKREKVCVRSHEAVRGLDSHLLGSWRMAPEPGFCPRPTKEYCRLHSGHTFLCRVEPSRVLMMMKKSFLTRPNFNCPSWGIIYKVGTFSPFSPAFCASYNTCLHMLNDRRL